VIKTLCVKVCPKCGSENVKIDPGNPKAAAGFSTTSYICLDCGFSGNLFPEIEKKLPEKARPALEHATAVKIEVQIKNTDLGDATAEQIRQVMRQNHSITSP